MNIQFLIETKTEQCLCFTFQNTFTTLIGTFGQPKPDTLYILHVQTTLGYHYGFRGAEENP